MNKLVLACNGIFKKNIKLLNQYLRSLQSDLVSSIALWRLQLRRLQDVFCSQNRRVNYNHRTAIPANTNERNIYCARSLSFPINYPIKWKNFLSNFCRSSCPYL